MTNELIPIQNMIYEIRGHKVMIDCDLAELYGVPTFRINEVVKRNNLRFPSDFMFQLTKEEWENLRSQFAISSLQYGGRRYIPYAFTEQGIAMLSGLLNSDIAIKVNIEIMRAFVKLRHYVFSKTDIAEQVTELRKLLMLHIESNDNKFDELDVSINQIFRVLNNLIEKPKETKRIGFTTN